MDFLSKYVKKSAKSDKESELEIQLENLQEKYNVLKESHEYTVKLLEESKKGDNSILHAYNRLKNQFQELSHFVSVKKNQDCEIIIKQQAELSKRRDFLDAREKALNEREKKINAKEIVVGLLENGERIEDLVEDYQKVKDLNEKLGNELEVYKKAFWDFKVKLRDELRVVKGKSDEVRKELLEIQGVRGCLEEFGKSMESVVRQVMENFKKKVDVRVEESKRIEKVEAKKSVIPLSFKKKPSIPLKSSEIDLEKELGNSFNS